MKRMLKFVELGWIVVAVISLVEIVRLWGTFDNTFWIFTGTFLVSAFMYFFRRRQRLRYEENLKNKPSDR